MKQVICKIDGCEKHPIALGLCSAHYYRNKRNGSPFSVRKAPNGSLMRWIESHKDYRSDDCLKWPFATDKRSGYARMGGKGGFASRYMCIAAHGPAPTHEHQAAHACGNGHLGCVNPKHLSWKTPLENSADKDAHGTQVRGEAHALSKLTEQSVREIRSLLESGVSQREIARQFQVPYQRIWKIKHKEAWAWVS